MIKFQQNILERMQQPKKEEGSFCNRIPSGRNEIVLRGKRFQIGEKRKSCLLSAWTMPQAGSL